MQRIAGSVILMCLIILAACVPTPAAQAPGSVPPSPTAAASAGSAPTAVPVTAVVPAATAKPAASPTSQPATPAVVASVPGTAPATAAAPATALSLRPDATPASTSLVPAGWPTYSAASLGFTLAYPPAWEPCQETGQSRLFCRRQTAPAGPAFPAFYVTVIPAGFTNADAEAYNFISEEKLRAFAPLPVGQSQATNALPEYSTFTRLPDTTVDQLPGVVIENSRVWEGGANTKDRRVLVAVGTTTFMLGTYYETPAELAEFERVLAGVRFSHG